MKYPHFFRGYLKGRRMYLLNNKGQNKKDKDTTSLNNSLNKGATSS